MPKGKERLCGVKTRPPRAKDSNTLGLGLRNCKVDRLRVTHSYGLKLGGHCCGVEIPLKGVLSGPAKGVNSYFGKRCIVS